MFCYIRIISVFILFKMTTLDAFTLEMIESSPKSVGGQSPHWDTKSQSLFYCDLFGIDKTICRYCPADQRVYCATIDGIPIIAFIVPVKGTRDEFVLGTNKTIFVAHWDGKSPKAKWIRNVLEVEKCPEFETNLFHDAKADPRCRLFAGTRRDQICDDLEIPTYGNLFRLSADEPAVTLNPPRTVRFSNGMAWDERTNTYYYIDSCSWDIKAFDWCPYTGDLSNKRVVYKYTYDNESASNLLKAITVDNLGKLWVSTFGGGVVIQIDPRNGKKIMEIPFPCKLLSGLAWGGKNYDELYVSTTSFPFYGLGSDTEAGRLFQVTGTGSRGNKKGGTCV